MSETKDKAKLFQKMAKVMGEINRIPKTGYNSFHKYKYVTETDLTEKIRGLLSENGIAFFPSVLATEQIPLDSKGGDLTRVVLECTFACTETGETFTTRFEGYGQDVADKGIYKAYTGAIKYMLMKTFLVSTGDDPEQEPQGATKSTASGKPTGNEKPFVATKQMCVKRMTDMGWSGDAKSEVVDFLFFTAGKESLNDMGRTEIERVWDTLNSGKSKDELMEAVNDERAEAAAAG